MCLIERFYASQAFLESTIFGLLIYATKLVSWLRATNGRYDMVLFRMAIWTEKKSWWHGSKPYILQMGTWFGTLQLWRHGSNAYHQARRTQKFNRNGSYTQVTVFFNFKQILSEHITARYHTVFSVLYTPCTFFFSFTFFGLTNTWLFSGFWRISSTLL